jgi:hypothetical protein
MSTSPRHDAPDPPVGDVLVYRLVPTHWCSVVEGQWEFQSAAFDNATPETEDECPDDMSVVLGDTLASLERSPGALPAETPWAGDEYGVAVLEAKFLRDEEQQRMFRTPKAEEPAHGDVCGKKNFKRRRRLKKHARWLVRPAAEPRSG